MNQPRTTPPSKIVQIQAASQPGDHNSGPHVQLFALCEDGSLWLQYQSSGFSNVPTDGLWRPVVAGDHTPLSELKAALHADPDYAWSWQCNLACIGIDSVSDISADDSITPHETANRRAAQFMSNAFDLDIRTNEHWKELEPQWQSEEGLTVTGRAKRLMNQVMKTWEPPATTAGERKADIAQTATMLAIAYIMGREFITAELNDNQRVAIDDGLKVLVEVLDAEPPTLEEWMDGWAVAVQDGQSSISRYEAERRYYREYGRSSHRNGEG